MSKETDQRSLEAATLRWIAQLPLVREDDIPRLTGAPKPETQAALQALTRFGWIERLRVRSSEFGEEHARYLVRAVAAQPFAGAFGMSADEAHSSWPIGWTENLAHVTTVVLTDFVNGLLVSLVANYGRTDFEVADIRSLPRSRRDAASWWPPDVEAYGCLRHQDRFAHFFVAWDRAAAPKVHRQMRVRGWYDAAETRDHWGEGSLPPILLVLPSSSLEPEWARSVAATAQRRYANELEVYVTSESEAYGEVIGPIWHRLGEEGTTTLSSTLRWTNVPPAVDVPSVRYDLLARGVDVQAPTVSEWAAGVLGRGNAGPRDRSAAVAVRLESPHRDVRELLARHPFLSNNEVAVRLELIPQLVQRVLRDLTQYGLAGALGEP